MNEVLSTAAALEGQSSACDPSAWCVQPVENHAAAAPVGIGFEDWDLLFRAALELLARIAIERTAPEGAAAGLQPPGTALRECIGALDELRRAHPDTGSTVTH